MASYKLCKLQVQPIYNRHACRWGYGGFRRYNFGGRRLVINAFSLYYSCEISQNDFRHFASQKKTQEDFKPNSYKWPWDWFLGIKRFLRSLVKLGFKVSRSRNRSRSFLRVVQDTSRVKVAKGKMPFKNLQWDKNDARTSGTPGGLTIRYSFWHRFGFFSRNGAWDSDKHFAFQLITKDFDV